MCTYVRTYVCTYVYMYVCMQHTYVRMCMREYVCVLCTYVCICVYASICMCMYVHMYVPMYVSVCMRVYVCVCMYICSTYACMYVICACICVYATYVCMYVCNVSMPVIHVYVYDLSMWVFYVCMYVHMQTNLQFLTFVFRSALTFTKTRVVRVTKTTFLLMCLSCHLSVRWNNILLYIIIIIRHDLGLHRPVSTSSIISSKVFQFVFVHLVYKSALFLASCCYHSCYMS